MNLWLTKPPANERSAEHLQAIRALRTIRQQTDEQDTSFTSAQSLLKASLTAPVLILVSEDQSELKTAQNALNECGCETYIGDNPPAVTIDTTDAPSYAACRVAMILLAQPESGPTTAYIICQTLGRVARSEGLDETENLLRETAEVLLDTFAAEGVI